MQCLSVTSYFFDDVTVAVTSYKNYVIITAHAAKQ